MNDTVTAGDGDGAKQSINRVDGWVADVHRRDKDTHRRTTPRTCSVRHGDQGNSLRGLARALLAATSIFAVLVSGDSGAQGVAVEVTAGTEELRPLVPESMTCADVISWLPVIAASNASASPGIDVGGGALEGDRSNVFLVQALNRGYLKMQENFFALMDRNAPYMKRQTFLICMDNETVAYMARLGVRCVEVDRSGISPEKEREMVWIIRMKAMRCLVESGRDVVLSDNDAVWLKDPIKELSLLEGDVIGSRAPWPAKLGDPVFHVTMCMGFILFRAGGEGMAKFQSTIHEFMVEAEDDQIAINKAIASLQPVYYYNMAISDMRFKESTAPGRGVLSALPGTFRVTYLPHSTYTRYCKDVPITEETVLGHCHNWGNPQMRIQHMKEAGTWALGN